MGDGIIRIVQLPAYGLFLIQAAVCPALFRLKGWHSVLLLIFGTAMIIVGGNRAAILCVVVSVPVILILRRSTHVLALMLGFGVAGIGMLHYSIDQSTTGEISPLVRSLGIFDSKIDKASGGDASAEWRYEIWQSGIDKIMQSPIVGKGFGNLPKHLEPTAADVMSSTDFEVILAGGEAHNGFVTAAYGFGIPFMAALTIGLIIRMVSLFKSALMVDKHDQELRDLYAFFTAMFPAYFVNIYTAFDMSVTGLWVYVAMAFIMDNLPKNSVIVDTVPSASPNVQTQNPQLYGGTWAYSGGKFNAKRK